MKYVCFYHETYIKLFLGIDALQSLLNVYFAFPLFIFDSHNLRLFRLKLNSFWKLRIIKKLRGIFKVRLLLNEARDTPFLFHNLSSLNISNQQAKFERKSIVSFISTESP